MVEPIKSRVNGADRSVEADPAASLLGVLRGQLGLTGTNFGCGANQCGACHVLIDGAAVASCDTPLWAATGKDIVTVEGLGTPEQPHPIQQAFDTPVGAVQHQAIVTIEGLAPDGAMGALQQAFLAEQAGQCGYCLPGILISAAALLRRNPDPSDADVRAALDRNLCRCGAHNRIVRAVLRAAREART